MNVYMVKLRDNTITFTAAHKLPDVFRHTNEDWQQEVTEVVEILSGMSFAEIERHSLPIAPAM